MKAPIHCGKAMWENCYDAKGKDMYWYCAECDQHYNKDMKYVKEQDL